MWPYLIKGCLGFFIVSIIFSVIGSCCVYVAEQWEDRSVKKLIKADKKTNRKIEKALSVRDFEKARDLCYTLNKGEREVKEKIDMTELNFHMDNGDLEIAESVSKEFDCRNLFFDLLKSNFSTYLRDKKYDDLIEILSAWEFENVYQVTGNAYRISYIEDVNRKFNLEMQSYNQLVDRLLDAALLDNNLELARKCLILYKPIAKLKTKVKLSDGTYDCTFRLSNVSKAIAVERLKEYKQYM